jgi:hypothetical protein
MSCNEQYCSDLALFIKGQGPSRHISQVKKLTE